MKSLLMVFACVFGFCLFAQDADAKVPKLFSDEVKFVTVEQYKKDIKTFSERLEKHGYDVKAAVDEAKAEHEKRAAEAAAEIEKQVAERESKLTGLVASLGSKFDEKLTSLVPTLSGEFDSKLAEVMPDQPTENPADKPLLYTLIVAALTMAGYGGWKAHVAASVVQKMKDRVAA